MMISNEPVANQEEESSSEPVEETGAAEAPQVVHTASHTVHASMMPASANIGHNLAERAD